MAVQGVAQPFGIPAGPLYQCLDAVITGIQQCQQQMTRLKLVVPMSYRQGLCVGDATLQFGSELVETHSVSSIGGGTMRSDAPLRKPLHKCLRERITALRGARNPHIWLYASVSCAPCALRFISLGDLFSGSFPLSCRIDIFNGVWMGSFQGMSWEKAWRFDTAQQSQITLAIRPVRPSSRRWE